MKAYASLHFRKPESQNDAEVSYPGYHRIPVEWDESFGDPAVKIEFPVIQQDADGEATWWAIGTAEIGDGDLLQAAEFHPPRPLRKTQYLEVAGRVIPLVPSILIGNILQLPEGLHPIAAVAYALVNYKEMKAEDLHPALYEAINDELTRCGVPVIPVSREAKFEMNVKLSQLNLSNLIGDA